MQQAQEVYVPALEAGKILYPDLSQGPKFSLNTEGEYSSNTAYFIPSNDWVLLGLLNSNVTWFYLRGISDAMRGGVWRLRMFTQNIETIPIPDLKGKTIARLSEDCQKASEACYALQQALTRRIPDLAAPDIEPKLTNKLKSWWEFPDFAAFRKEVKKALKADIPLSERSDWEDWIARDKAEIARLTAEIKSNEDRINAIIYDVFNLTQDEIILLEASL